MEVGKPHLYHKHRKMDLMLMKTITLYRSKIESDSNFPILYKIKGEELIVYVRGSKFQVKYFSDLVDLIDEINDQEVIDIKPICQKE